MLSVCFFFFVFASLYVVQPLLPVFVRDFDISVSEATLTLSINIVGLIIGLIVLGFFFGSIGRVPFIKYSLLASVIPFLLIPMTDSFYFFYSDAIFARICTGRITGSLTCLY